MTSLYNHFSWFLMIFCLLLSSLWLSFYVSFYDTSIFFVFNIFDLTFFDLTFSVHMNYMSSWFFTTVLFISSVIMVYSYNYMSPYSKSPYFLWFTVLFILSMLIVISVNNLFYVMLGWDGLGLISFFLIVYYQNQSSVTSGLFTIIMNRIGDSFFLLSLVLFFYFSPDLTYHTYFKPSFFVVTFLLVTYMTKSALFPFSPWLPAAMAAPTPISALVHSSTLVTAGLFLMMRFSYFFYSCPSLMTFLMIVSVFTSFYAGMNTVFEKDLKKLIALSTLSHLGFIGLAFSSGLLNLAFFHMLTHALFKSLLFMTMGDIMINLNHSQDIRYLSSGYVLTPFSSFVMNVSIFNLVGLPTLSGYFSKDLVLEDMLYSFSSYFFYFLVLLNVFFTYYYSYTLLYFSFQPLKLVPYQLVHSPMFSHSVLMFILSIMAVTFGVFFMSHVVSTLAFLVVPSFLKFFPFILNLSFFFLLLIFRYLFSSRIVFLNSYFSQMMFLTPFMMTLSSKVFSSFAAFFNKSFEAGSFNFVFNSYPYHLVSSISFVLYRNSMMNPMNLIFFSSFLFFVFILV